MMLVSEASSFRTRVARSVFWLAWSRGVLQVCSFATTLLIAHILAPADYGVMALASFWTGTLSMLAEMGLGAAIIQFRDLERREIDACFWITLSLATLAFFGLVLSAPVIASWFGEPRLADVLPVLALVLPVIGCRVVSDSLLRKRLALDRVSQAEMIGGVVTLPVMLGCAFAGFGIWTLVIGALLAPAVQGAATIVFAPWLPGVRLGGARLKEVIRFSLSTLGVKAIWGMREYSNTLIIGKLAGPVTLGFYSMADQLAHLPGSKISPVVNMLSAPIMAELQANIDAMRAAFYKAVRLTAAIALPTSAGIALVADEMVAALLGPKWLSSVTLLRLICVYAAVRAVDVLLPPVLFARRRERFLFRYCVVLLVVVPAAAVLGGLWDRADPAPGVIVFSTAAYCVIVTVMAKEALAEIKSSFFQLWNEIWPIFAATVIMTAVVLLLREVFLTGRPPSPWIGLIFLSGTGAMAYVAALFAIGRPLIGDGAEVLGWVLGRRSADS